MRMSCSPRAPLVLFTAFYYRGEGEYQSYGRASSLSGASMLDCSIHVTGILVYVRNVQWYIEHLIKQRGWKVNSGRSVGYCMKEVI